MKTKSLFIQYFNIYLFVISKVLNKDCKGFFLSFNVCIYFDIYITCIYIDVRIVFESEKSFNISVL